MRKRVAIFGGSFDPPHNGHVLTMAHLLNDPEIEEVWVVPSGDARYDKPSVAPASVRKQLLECLWSEVFRKNCAIRLCWEQFGADLADSTAIALVERFRQQGEDRPFYWVIGADNVATLSQWQRYEELCQQVVFLVVPRIGDSLPEPLPDGVRLLGSWRDVMVNYASFSLSSSELRGLLATGAEVAGYLPEPLRARIEEEGWYGRRDGE
ncbi:nicotinate-nicotinamide nucleotide adenylyltransferase [bacterium]|nr:nicotinate-nicotinamide nucleotide adenylyltransferase [bacterium]